MSKQFSLRLVLSLVGLLLIVGCGSSGDGGGTSLLPGTTTDTSGTTDTGTNNSGGSTEIEPNDSFSAAQLITAGLDYTGQNNGGSDSNDYFKVTASGSSMSVSLSHITANASGSDFSVYIYNSSQTQIAYFSSSNGIDNSMTTGIISGETYYIKVYVSYGDAHQYKLKASFSSASYELEPNDDFATAQAITSGLDYLGQNNNGSDSNDYFKVIAAGSSIAVSLSHLTTNASGSDFSVYIYNSSQTQIAYFSSINGIDNSMTTGITSGQTYYIKVYVGYGGNYQYKLKAIFSGTYYEQEPNEDFSTAQAITAGLDYIGQDNGGSDSNDYFKVTASGSSMTVSLSHLTANASSSFSVYIYNSSQTQIAYFSANSGIDNSMTTGVTSGQIYYIKVYLVFGGAYQYKLKASFGSAYYELEPNNDFASAQTMTSNVDYIGQNNGNENYDYFKVTASGSSMTVSLSHLTANASGSDFSVYVYDASQNQIEYFNAYNGVDNSTVVTGLTSSLTYYIKVFVGYSGSYQYILNP